MVEERYQGTSVCEVRIGNLVVSLKKVKDIVPEEQSMEAIIKRC
jgi:hypothetical protein